MGMVKCQFCLVKGDKTLMEKGIHKRGYIHKNCIVDFHDNEKKKAVDQEQRRELYSYLLCLHNAIEIPARNLLRLKEIKENKNIEYSLILEAYKLSEDKIKWFISNVLDYKNDSEGINACITMMLKHGINPAFQERKNKAKQEIYQTEMYESKTRVDMSLGDVARTKVKDEMDISHLL
ncbi:hypothetical protein [Paenibacillus sp. HGH0039]|uniref:hypothetical protein n=1 Tax=Paenibacillus sp. HGH0039 TaxID=1078505 RepID=UPI00034E89E3|nr:hypothetical protein [Paenibacillus sp. HGH0039]EPD81349.1 hypothetical protein HMPREF1207_05107 [Paenibacillus sp. HGH0039]